MNLLKITVSGYKMLEDDFTINFVTKAKVSNDVDESEIIEIDENLYTYSIMALTGSNSSGKSTTLQLISSCILLMQTGRWIYNKRDFSSDCIKLHLEFYKDKVIHIYDSCIKPSEVENMSEYSISFCNIVNERLKSAQYLPTAGKRYLKELNFIEDNENFYTNVEDTSALVYMCKDQFPIDYMGPFANNGNVVKRNFFSYFDNYFSNELTTAIIHLLDDSIEYIISNKNNELIRFKRINEDEQLLTKLELLSVLSNGTIKGIELYIRIIKALKTGGMMIVDEIENCFHKNLVNNILFLLTDKSINKKGTQIIFSTHYVEILDIFKRRDNIFIMHKNKKIEISNLYDDYDIRTEILKSKQFNNNTFNTLLNYDNLMKVKRLIKNEISNND